jgi:hypothetical protein
MWYNITQQNFITACNVTVPVHIWNNSSLTYSSAFLISTNPIWNVHSAAIYTFQVQGSSMQNKPMFTPMTPKWNPLEQVKIHRYWAGIKML